MNRILILIAALYLVGCGQNSNWHHGTWTVGAPTETISEDSPPEEIAAGMWASVFANGTGTIDADIITFDLGEQKVSRGYLIAENVASSEIRIVLEDDAVHRIRKVSGGIEVTVNGSGDLKGAEGAWVRLKRK